MVRPARASAFRVAAIGPRPMTDGSRPTTAVVMMRASGLPTPVVPPATISSAEAPSLMPLELPAVTEPSAAKAGFSAASLATVTSGRGCSSRSTTTGSPFFCGIVTGTISSVKMPSAIACEARRWLSAPNASCCSRVMPYCLATFSAVMPSEIVQSLFIFGLVKRHPSVESATATSLFQGEPDLSIT